LSFSVNFKYLRAEFRFRPCPKSHFKLLKRVSDLRFAFDNSQRQADLNTQLRNA